MPAHLLFFQTFLPTRLLGPTRLLNFRIFSHQHCYSDSKVIRHPRVIFVNQPSVWQRQQQNPFTLRWRIVLPTSYGLILGIFCTKTCRLHSTILLHGIAHFSDDPFELECLKMSLKLDYSTYYMLKKKT